MSASSIFRSRTSNLLTSAIRSNTNSYSSSRVAAFKNSNINTTSFRRNFQTTSPKMVVHNIENKAAFDSAIKDNKVVVLDAFATWCGPCKVISPQVDKFSDDFTNAHFVKLDVDEVPDVAQELNIRAMPTFLVFKDGEKVAEVVGANPQALYAAISKSVL